MKHLSIAKQRDFFKPLIASRNVQAATMVLKAGQSSSDQVENEHPKAEQWLYVIAGAGRAKVGRRAVRLKAGSLLLVEKNEPHQISNTGDEPLVTVNFYSPPAYTKKGEVKPSVKRRSRPGR
ncbi:MAG: Mannose-6-phosphate isomerase [Phycisphaerales bacterium]|jgi:mannose-6-phosphate isomerase-like protein (cupin superfamily)|nr:Mannose-6-phosphate isomerase [Phycisphaerales bacterium]